MNLEGVHLIGNHSEKPGYSKFFAYNPETGEKINPSFGDATEADINKGLLLASRSFPLYRQKSGPERAKFLTAIAEEIEKLGDALLSCCHLETALPLARLEGERNRTINQIRLFADLIENDRWRDIRTDQIKKDGDLPDIHLAYYRIPLGPVAVFGASNFPLAFSVAGGDTISALAAGCPVIVKAHFSHPGTSEMVGKAILSAANRTGMPEGVFSMFHGQSNQVGMDLVMHPLLKAVGFTGSFSGGRSLFNAAASREIPIPVYAEMGSTNPVIFLPGIISDRGPELAKNYVDSVTLGVGQFCTNPGISILIGGDENHPFVKKTAELMEQIECGTMLNKRTYDNYNQGIANLSKSRHVKILTNSTSEIGKAKSHLFITDSISFQANSQLSEEIFGPASLIVTVRNKDELKDLIRTFKGFLTISLFGNETDLHEYGDFLPCLEEKAGRIIYNSFPTGVEVSPAMNHGGPYPATTDSRSTSVGTASIDRFVRPVCYQNWPPKHLPKPLHR